MSILSKMQERYNAEPRKSAYEIAQSYKRPEPTAYDKAVDNYKLARNLYNNGYEDLFSGQYETNPFNIEGIDPGSNEARNAFNLDSAFLADIDSALGKFGSQYTKFGGNADSLSYIDRLSNELWESASGYEQVLDSFQGANALSIAPDNYRYMQYGDDLGYVMDTSTGERVTDNPFRNIKRGTSNEDNDVWYDSSTGYNVNNLYAKNRADLGSYNGQMEKQQYDEMANEARANEEGVLSPLALQAAFYNNPSNANVGGYLSSASLLNRRDGPGMANTVGNQSITIDDSFDKFTSGRDTYVKRDDFSDVIDYYNTYYKDGNNLNGYAQYHYNKDQQSDNTLGILGALLSFTPFAPLGYAMSAVNAAENENWAGVALAGLGGFMNVSGAGGMLGDATQLGSQGLGSAQIADIASQTYGLGSTSAGLLGQYGSTIGSVGSGLAGLGLGETLSNSLANQGAQGAIKGTIAGDTFGGIQSGLLGVGVGEALKQGSEIFKDPTPVSGLSSVQTYPYNVQNGNDVTEIPLTQTLPVSYTGNTLPAGVNNMSWLSDFTDLFSGSGGDLLPNEEMYFDSLGNAGIDYDDWPNFLKAGGSDNSFGYSIDYDTWDALQGAGYKLDNLGNIVYDQSISDSGGLLGLDKSLIDYPRSAIESIIGNNPTNLALAGGALAAWLASSSGDDATDLAREQMAIAMANRESGDPIRRDTSFGGTQSGGGNGYVPTGTQSSGSGGGTVPVGGNNGVLQQIQAYQPAVPGRYMPNQMRLAMGGN